MKTSVILTVSNTQKNIAQSIVSVIESNTRPNNLAIIFDNTTSNNQWETGRAFFKGCCGNSSYSEEIDDSSIILKKNYEGINMTGIKLNKIYNHELNNYAINYLFDETDVFFTLSSGTEISKCYIDNCLKVLSDSNIGAVYTDYIEDGKIQYLQSLHPYAMQNIKIKEIAFKKSLVEKSPIKSNYFTFAKDLSSRSIIKHLPEPLLIA